MNHEYETLRVESKDPVVTITLHRPDKLNALNLQMMKELDDLFGRLRNRDDLRGVIMKGAGEKAFAAGADISELSGLNREEGEARAKLGQTLFNEIESFPCPVIAVVNGYALGGGAELALACHLRFGCEETRLGLPETGLGLIPGFGGTQRMTRLAGRSTALDLILSGRHVKGREAKEIGLLNRLVPREQLLDSAHEWMGQVVEKGPLAIQAALKAVRSAGRDTGYEQEAALFGQLFESEDGQEGTAAFLEKRPPNFKGR